MADLSDKTIAILVDNYFENAEFTGPKKALEDAGATVHVIAVEKNEVQGMDSDVEPAEKHQADHLIDDINTADYDALVMPGGTVNADHLRMNNKARSWVKDFLDGGKVVEAICHAPWVLISAGVASGRRLTSFPSLQDDLRNAEATWVDEEVVVDGNLITSRNPDDVPAFSKAIITALENGQ